MITEFTEEYSYITNNESEFFWQTTTKVVKTQLNKDKLEFETVIPEKDGFVLESVHCFAEEYLAVTFMHDVKNVLQIFNLRGDLINTVSLPAVFYNFFVLTSGELTLLSFLFVNSLAQWEVFLPERTSKNFFTNSLLTPAPEPSSLIVWIPMRVK